MSGVPKQLTNKELATLAGEIFEPILKSEGLFLEEINCEVHSKERFLTVYVDRITPINLDEIAAVSRLLSNQIDSDPRFGDAPFNFEVTTPGLERPLTLPRHWKKNEHRLVRIITVAGSEIKGRIGDSDDSAVEIDGKKISYAQIKRALIEIEFKSTASKQTSNKRSNEIKIEGN